INRMLDKDPENRYQSYDELIEHLNYARAQLQEKSAQVGPQRQRVVVGGGAQEKAMALMTLGLIALVVAAGVMIFIFRDSIFGGGKVAERPSAPVETGQKTASRERYRHAWEILLRGDSASAA